MEVGRTCFSFEGMDHSQLMLNFVSEMQVLFAGDKKLAEDFLNQVLQYFLSETMDFSTKTDPKQILESKSVHPDLIGRVRTLLKEAQSQGLDVMLFEGFRSHDRQNELYNSQRGVTRASGGNSYHNYGLAVDIVFKDSKGQPSWAETHDWKKLGDIGKKLGFVWGGDFKTLKDRSHFEFHPGLNIAQIRELFSLGGKDLVWQKISEFSK